MATDRPSASKPTSEQNAPKPERGSFVHNCVAHPLLFLWPRVGTWLHERTAP